MKFSDLQMKLKGCPNAAGDVMASPCQGRLLSEQATLTFREMQAITRN